MGKPDGKVSRRDRHNASQIRTRHYVRPVEPPPAPTKLSVPPPQSLQLPDRPVSFREMCTIKQLFKAGSALALSEQNEDVFLSYHLVRWCGGPWFDLGVPVECDIVRESGRAIPLRATTIRSVAGKTAPHFKTVRAPQADGSFRLTVWIAHHREGERHVFAWTDDWERVYVRRDQLATHGLGGSLRGTVVECDVFKTPFQSAKFRIHKVHSVTTAK